MSDAQTYYDGLLAQGYTADQALSYTHQYYPGFAPAAAMPAPAPEPAPVAAAPAYSAEPTFAAPEPTYAAPAATPAYDPTPSYAAATPAYDPTASLASDPMSAMGAVASMPAMGAGEAKEAGPELMIALAAGAVSLLLVLVALFGNAWLVEESDSGDTNMGLTTMMLDCEGLDEANQSECQFMGYLFLLEDMEGTLESGEEPETYPMQPSGDIQDFCDNSYDFMAAFIEGFGGEVDQEMKDANADCDATASAGSIAKIILWVSVLALLAFVVGLVLTKFKPEMLPEAAGRFVWLEGAVGGGLVLLAVVLWVIMLPSGGDMSLGWNFYVAIVAGLAAAGSGVFLKMKA